MFVLRDFPPCQSGATMDTAPDGFRHAVSASLAAPRYLLVITLLLFVSLDCRQRSIVSERGNGCFAGSPWRNHVPAGRRSSCPRSSARVPPPAVIGIIRSARPRHLSLRLSPEHHPRYLLSALYLRTAIHSGMGSRDYRSRGISAISHVLSLPSAGPRAHEALFARNFDSGESVRPAKRKQRWRWVSNLR